MGTTVAADHMPASLGLQCGPCVEQNECAADIKSNSNVRTYKTQLTLTELKKS